MGSIKIPVWSGNIDNEKWIQANQLSNFYEVIEIGVGKKKRPVVSDADIITFDGEYELKIVEKQFCMEMEENNCIASQGGYSSAH